MNLQNRDHGLRVEMRASCGRLRSSVQLLRFVPGFEAVSRCSSSFSGEPAALLFFWTLHRLLPRSLPASQGRNVAPAELKWWILFCGRGKNNFHSPICLGNCYLACFHLVSWCFLTSCVYSYFNVTSPQGRSRNIKWIVWINARSVGAIGKVVVFGWLAQAPLSGFACHAVNPKLSALLLCLYPLLLHAASVIHLSLSAAPRITPVTIAEEQEEQEELMRNHLQRETTVKWAPPSFTITGPVELQLEFDLLCICTKKNLFWDSLPNIGPCWGVWLRSRS